MSRGNGRLSTRRGIFFALLATLLILASLELASDLYYLAAGLADPATALRNPARAGGPKPLAKRNAARPKWLETDYLRMRLAPDLHEMSMGTFRSKVSTSELGFRITPLREGGQGPRIAFLGDSVTFGWAASRDAATYPALVEEQLAPLDADVINAAWPRFNSMDILDLYVSRVMPLDLDYVVIMMGWNDIAHEFGPNDPAPIPPSRLQQIAQAFSGSSSLARALGDAAIRLQRRLPPPTPRARKLRILEERETSAEDFIYWDRLPEHREIIEALVSLIRSRGAEPVLVTLPHYLDPPVSLDDQLRMIAHLRANTNLSIEGWRRLVYALNDNVREVAKSRGVQVIEAEHAVDPQHFADICHPRDEGNRQLARHVARALKRRILRDQKAAGAADDQPSPSPAR